MVFNMRALLLMELDSFEWRGGTERPMIWDKWRISGWMAFLHLAFGIYQDNRIISTLCLLPPIILAGLSVIPWVFDLFDFQFSHIVLTPLIFPVGAITLWSFTSLIAQISFIRFMLLLAIYPFTQGFIFSMFKTSLFYTTHLLFTFEYGS